MTITKLNPPSQGISTQIEGISTKRGAKTDNKHNLTFTQTHTGKKTTYDFSHLKRLFNKYNYIGIHIFCLDGLLTSKETGLGYTHKKIILSIQDIYKVLIIVTSWVYNTTSTTSQEVVAYVGGRCPVGS